MIQDLISFLRFTHQFQEVERMVPVLNSDRLENDAEHSYQLAMVAWYLIERDRLAFDLQKVLGYALVHDLVEVYAGDTYIFAHDDLHQTKRAREAEAAQRIAEEFPEFPALHQLIREYEHQETPEAIFVYALDKLLPVINIYLDNGKFWKREGIDLLKVKEVKDKKIATSPEVDRYYQEFLKELTDQQLELFGPNA